MLMLTSMAYAACHLWRSPVLSIVGAKVVGTGHHVLKVECYSWLKVTHHGKNYSYKESCAFKAGGHV
jgi:hypothetical protein